MAGRFGCNPAVAGQVARALAEVRSDMDSLGTFFDRFDGVTGSTRVESALDALFAESSDNRSRMGKLLDRASGLLRALAQGTTDVDAALAKSFEPPRDVSEAPDAPAQSRSRVAT